MTGGGGGGQQSFFENTSNFTINSNATVESPISVSRSGNAPSDLRVGVDIKHTYRGDLVIDLVAPDGSTYRLKNSNGRDGADNVITTYTVNASSESANGTWRLRVRDVFNGDDGFIDDWSLQF
ncbi:MAG: proprotein convertase P-domain-containing protein [Xanthomonadales bacterium]|nr:proprotein convertase P-domain-containing protein [Xanthomonadales bacterium]